MKRIEVSPTTFATVVAVSVLAVRVAAWAAVIYGATQLVKCAWGA